VALVSLSAIRIRATDAVGAVLAVVLAGGLVAAVALPGSTPEDDQGAGSILTFPGAPDDVPELPVNPALALASAALRSVQLEDDLGEQVRFCFTGTVREAGPARRLALLGPDVDVSVTAVAVNLLVADDRCLLARFAPGTPVNRYTLAVALDGAAHDTNAASVASTAPLTGTPPETAVVEGGTSGPDLVAVSVDRTLDHVELVFDEPLDERAPRVPATFVYWTLRGDLHEADGVLSVERNTVVVVFSSDDDDVENIVRLGALRGAVRGRDGELSTPAAKDLVAPGGTVAPDLARAERVAGSDALWDFTFDEPVTDAVPELFTLYSSDGAQVTGADLTRPTPHTVRVVLPAADDAADEQVLAVAAPAAVRGLDASRAASTLGVVRIGSYDAAPGRTTGPDLLVARLEARAGTLRLEFDERLEDDQTVDASAVLLVLPDGGRVPARRAVEVAGRSAFLLVDATAAEVAARVVVGIGAIRGRDDEASAPASVVPER
jgi:hypothetical protein